MTAKSMSKIFLTVIALVMAFFIRNGFPLEPYPNRPITLVCGWGAGGGMDISSRALSKAAEKQLRVPIINENKAGATGVIAKSYVCNSKPDGYTLGITGSTTYLIQPQMRKTPYNPMTDITDIMVYGLCPYGLAVNTDSPWKSFEEVIEYARKNPGKFSFGCGGIGNIHHLCMERIGMKEEIKWTAIPYKSGQEAVLSCIGGHTKGVVQGTPDILPQIKAGRLRLVLSLDEKRWVEVPNIPTVLEKNYDFTAFTVYSIYASKGMPEDIRQKLETAFKNAMEDSSFIDVMKTLQIERYYLSGKKFSNLWRSQYDEMGKVLNGLGLVEK